jgi:hypothetical protein
MQYSYNIITGIIIIIIIIIIIMVVVIAVWRSGGDLLTEDRGRWL